MKRQPCCTASYAEGYKDGVLECDPYMHTWISVERKMPEDMQDVLFLAVLEGHKKEYVIGHHCAQGWSSCFLFNSHLLTNNEKILRVTHWLPLPEFPK